MTAVKATAPKPHQPSITFRLAGEGVRGRYTFFCTQGTHGKRSEATETPVSVTRNRRRPPKVLRAKAILIRDNFILYFVGNRSKSAKRKLGTNKSTHPSRASCHHPLLLGNYHEQWHGLAARAWILIGIPTATLYEY